MAETILNGRRFVEIPGFPKYFINEDGLVLSFSAMGPGANSRDRKSPHIVKAVLSQKGYPEVSLKDVSGRHVRRRVHRCVLLAFVGPPPAGHEACHNNGIRSDCRLSNLRWDTRQNNSRDKLAHGTLVRGSGIPWAKLSEENVVEIKLRLVKGDSFRSIAKDYGVSKDAVGEIYRGVNWRHVEPSLNERFPKRYASGRRQ